MKTRRKKLRKSRNLHKTKKKYVRKIKRPRRKYGGDDVYHDAEEVFNDININCGEDLKCPITQEIFVNPVITSDGQTYSREAITKWLQTHITSPITNTKLSNKTLIPNIIVRNLAEKR